jgi:hypothetical protein
LIQDRRSALRASCGLAPRQPLWRGRKWRTLPASSGFRNEFCWERDLFALLPADHAAIDPVLHLPAAVLAIQITPNERKVSVPALRVFFGVLLVGRHLNHPHHVLLGPAVALDVPLRGGKAAVAGELLNVPEATASLDNPLGGLSDEGPPAAVG